jgi:hypothetical protein
MKNLTDVDAFTSPITVVEGGVDYMTAANQEMTAQQVANRTLWLRNILSPASPVTRYLYIPATAFDWTGSTVTVADNQTVTVQTNYGRGIMALKNEIPTGATITGVECLANPGAARGGADRMVIEFTQIIHTWATPAVGGASTSTGTDDTTTNLQVFGNTGLSYPVSSTDRRQNALALIAGVDAAANNDVFYGVRITFTDPGPRSY